MRGLWVLWGEEAIPVTHLFDANDEEVADLAEAVTFYAGPLDNGGWLSGLVREHPEIWPQ